MKELSKADRTVAGQAPLTAATVAGLLLVVIQPLAWGLLKQTALAEQTLSVRLLVHIAMAWAATLALLLVALAWDRLEPSSIGLVPYRRTDPAWAAGGFLAMGALFFLSVPLVEALGLNTLEGGVRTLATVPVWIRVAGAVTAGVTEEILFRGYLVERLAALTGRLGIGVALSWILFTALHGPFWGLGGAIQIGLISAAIYFIYWRTRRVLPCILLHTANDLYAFLVVPLLMPEFS